MVVEDDRVDINGGSKATGGSSSLAPYASLICCLVIVAALYILVDSVNFRALESRSLDSSIVSPTELSVHCTTAPKVSWRTHHAGELICDLNSQKIDPDCPRFVYLPIAYFGGLGHKFLTYILGQVLAQDMKATYLYNNDSFLQLNWQNHGNYPWVEELLSFGYREMVYKEVMDKYQPAKVPLDNLDWDEVIQNNKDSCNVVFEPTEAICDSKVSCYFAAKPRVYERTKNLMRCKMMHSRASMSPPLAFEREKYNIAWHIRVGDVTRHADDREYYIRSKKQVDELLQGFNVSYHFFAESSESGTGPPPHYEFLSEIFPEAHFHSNLDVRTVLLHMMNANLLITAGSSLTGVALTASCKPVVLFDQPKEGGFYGFFLDSDVVLFDNGAIKDRTIDDVRSLIMYKYDLFHDKVIPDPEPLPKGTAL